MIIEEPANHRTTGILGRTRHSGGSYRPDIDGLRAVAISVVVLFHAGLACPGGYVGVDVFFVISGFLITSLIRREIDSGAFTFASFWERRARRLLPALFVVIAGTASVASVIYTPEDLVRLAKSILAQVSVLSNVFFCRQAIAGGGYFDSGAETKALLHTWSLSVEEQFYFLFPAVLVGLARWSARSARLLLAGLAAVSFLLGLVALQYSPASAFYLLPPRAWELLIGALLALADFQPKVSGRSAQVAGVIGIGLICGAVVCLDNKTAFPGAAALIPCSGTALLIATCWHPSSWVGRLLSSRPFVFLGLISYSLYLIHWPLLVFVRYVSVRPESTGPAVVAVALSVIAASLSWRLVEEPARRKKLFRTRRRIWTWVGICGASLAAFAVLVIRFDGFPARLNARATLFIHARRHFAYRNPPPLNRAIAGKFQPLGDSAGQPTTVLLWGDSHAMAVAPVIDALCREHHCTGILVGFHQTAPLVHYTSLGHYALHELSPVVADQVVRIVREQEIRNVVLVASWGSRELYPMDAHFRHQLRETITTLQACGAHVWVMKPVPQYDFDVPRLGAIYSMAHIDTSVLGRSPAELNQADSRLRGMYREAMDGGATVLDPVPFFQDHNGRSEIEANGHPLYIDGGHLSIEGAMLLKPLFAPLFEQKEDGPAHEPLS